MVASRHARTSVVAQKEVILRGLSKASSSPDETSPLEVLIRRLVALARSGSDAFSEAADRGQERVPLPGFDLCRDL